MKRWRLVELFYCQHKQARKWHLRSDEHIKDGKFWVAQPVKLKLENRGFTDQNSVCLNMNLLTYSIILKTVQYLSFWQNYYSFYSALEKKILINLC